MALPIETLVAAVERRTQPVVAPAPAPAPQPVSAQQQPPVQQAPGEAAAAFMQSVFGSLPDQGGGQPLGAPQDGQDGPQLGPVPVAGVGLPPQTLESLQPPEAAQGEVPVVNLLLRLLGAI